MPGRAKRPVTRGLNGMLHPDVPGRVGYGGAPDRCVPRQKETVAEIMQRWMETYAATNVTLHTQEGYPGT